MVQPGGTKVNQARIRPLGNVMFGSLLASVPSMTKDSQILDDVRVSGDENPGMHMAVSRGSDAIGTAGRGPEHVAEGGLALADRASVGGGTRHL